MFLPAPFLVVDVLLQPSKITFAAAQSPIMSAQEHEMWDDLNIQYEHAYRNNPFKKACVEHAIANLKPGSRVLDIGCGTGVPVAKMLAKAEMQVVGTDVAPNMVAIAQRAVEGEFQVADMVDYQPEGTFDAIFVIYSQLGLTYAAFHKAAYKFAQALRPGGFFVIGQSATDGDVPADDTAWDATRSYVEGYNLPFWGEPFPTLMFSRQAQRSFLESMGLTIVYDTLNDFQPDNPKCDVEHQQYIIAQLKGNVVTGEPLPAPSI
jgi:SAM-dependent methyltransferase